MSSLHEELKKPLTSDIENNIKTVENVLSKNIDVIKRDFFFHASKSISGVCFYTDGLVNTQQVEDIIKSLSHYKGDEISVSGVIMAENLKKNLLINASVEIIDNFQKGINGILMGDTFLLLNGCDRAFLISTRGWDARAVNEPQTEQVVRGPRDGFTENIRTNTALVRRRIRDPLLCIEGMQIGKKSKTDINIVYLEGTVKKGLVKEVKKRLERIKIDAVLESGYIEELINDSPLSPFKTVQNTERPDKVAAGILEGRVAIFVDNTPFVLIVPVHFWEFLQASDDYYSGFLAGSFFRLVRYFAFIISLTLPSIYVMLVSFHQEMIPTELALTIASGREVVPFPVLLEALIMELAFELMREAGLRMPKPVGQAVSIVGSLVIGQAAVQAGVVSPFMVIIVATTGIASFAIPNYSASFSIRIFRFPLLIASGTLGLLGFSAIFTILAVHALSIRSFGEAYLAPAAPFQPSDQKDFI
ncbi:MAG TPA: spore germination protein, partial [Bacillus bacterium]|nr:spore germination protein [Bacillus sp. (in: firmicutes)]